MASREPKVTDLPPLPPPATTLEGREDQLISAAMDVVERRLQDGSASAQEVVHFLKLGSVRNQLEQTKLAQENLVLEARTAEINRRGADSELIHIAIQHFKGYGGEIPMSEVPEFDENSHAFGA